MNKIFPQEEVSGNAAAGTKVLPGEEGCSALCCSRRGACLSAFVLLLLATLAALMALVSILGPPPRTPGLASCAMTRGAASRPAGSVMASVPVPTARTRKRPCALARRQLGPDVDFLLPHLSSVGDVPQSLPSFLVARCGDPASWIYSDQKCDGTNNCGDCSDELSPVTACPPCGPGWWRCPPTVFKYCDCIPRSLCRDLVQHCSDWSDENACPGP
ncbi:low-density lipoprotein receptor class A domain-containing protein 1 isoform 4-T4 [Molossus nigricans]